MPPMGLSGGGCGGDKGDQGVFFFEDQCRVLGLTGGESGDDSVVELVRFFLNSIRVRPAIICVVNIPCRPTSCMPYSGL